MTIPLWATLLALALPLPYPARYRLLRAWIVLQHLALRWMCRLKLEFEGTGHLPAGPAVVFCKHQSMLETIVTQRLMPPQTWVLKRELLGIPVFGWGLRALAPIAINRRQGSRALEEIVRQGRARLAQGLWVVVFPEGTRVRPGHTRTFGSGGASLAARAGVPVVPVAHNAGEHWLRGQLLIRPGTVRVRIGPTIDTTGLTTREINRRAKAWIDTATEALASVPTKSRRRARAGAA